MKNLDFLDVNSVDKIISLKSAAVDVDRLKIASVVGNSLKSIIYFNKFIRFLMCAL